MRELWNWLWRVGNMPATFGGQFTIISSILGGLAAAGLVARRILQYMELNTKTLLWAARQRKDDSVPTWLANQYKALNGNSKMSAEEKRDILGPKHDSGDKHQVATKGVVGDD